MHPKFVLQRQGSTVLSFFFTRVGQGWSSGLQHLSGTQDTLTSIPVCQNSKTSKWKSCKGNWLPRYYLWNNLPRPVPSQPWPLNPAVLTTAALQWLLLSSKGGLPCSRLLAAPHTPPGSEDTLSVIAPNFSVLSLVREALEFLYSGNAAWLSMHKGS